MVRFNRRYSVAVALLVTMISAAKADDLGSCDFNHPAGDCSAAFSLDKLTNEYTISANGTCQLVTVRIDGTSSTHRMRNDIIVQQISVFDKNKDYEFSVESCRRFNSKLETFNMCKSISATGKQNCFAPYTAALSSMLTSKGDHIRDDSINEYATILSDVQACLKGVAERTNQCAGFAAMKFVANQTSFGLERVENFR